MNTSNIHHCGFRSIREHANFGFVGPKCIVGLAMLLITGSVLAADPKVNFQKDIRPILSNRCFACHGPDEEQIEAGLRLDDAESAMKVLESGNRAIVAGDPNSSEVLRRIRSKDNDLRMPPPSFGEPLSEAEAKKIEQWISAGAPFARHWSFVTPTRPSLPTVDAKYRSWVRSPIDHFSLDKMSQHGLEPTKEADRATLIRRLSLDLTGVPPTLDDVQAFERDDSPQAYETLVERLLASPAFGEHWARKWLDLARYADSAGYADDPARTIWAYRDWVVRSINQDMPFDQFTIDQLAGDLLPSPTDDQLVATAFHRNTLTNNEGGTNDEEFRNVAVVDRVNTTMAVWMGVTMACAQCHSHKYDPISQNEYFRVFAIFNQSQDADRGDESPRFDVITPQQRLDRARWESELNRLQQELVAPHPDLANSLKAWQATLQTEPTWMAFPVTAAQLDSGNETNLTAKSIQALKVDAKDSWTITLDLPDTLELPAAFNFLEPAIIQLRTLPDVALPDQGAGFGGGNFVISKVSAKLVPTQSQSLLGRFIRIDHPGKEKILSLAEVEVFQNESNIAKAGKASQSTTDFGGDAARAIDGNTDGKYASNSTTHSAISDSPWWELDLGSLQSIDRLRIHNRIDGTVYDRLGGAQISILGAERQVLWNGSIEKGTIEPKDLAVINQPSIPITAAYADYEQPGFTAQGVLDQDPETGWAVGGSHRNPHSLSLLIEPPKNLPDLKGWRLQLRIESQSKHAQHVLGSFALFGTNDSNARNVTSVPGAILQSVRKPTPSEFDTQVYTNYFYQKVATELQPTRDRIAQLEANLATFKAITSVPVMRDLAKNQQRETFVQLRGNYRAKGDRVEPGLPTAFHPSQKFDATNRLGLAQWIIDPQNPLTARVLANRYWESLFGLGIVRTSEEFGSQGDMPSHPELLDWLATEMIRREWSTKDFLRLLVNSATYRQDSAVTPQRMEVDSENVYLSRGPRYRLSAEQVRDQALSVGGLLSHRMYGEPVKPSQPKLGLSAAFGSGTDWETSAGENRYRRGLYTTWRRSNPYPSMATFDAPNREVCTLRRDRTNTPLQALVTLNDPVYVEAAQGLARRILLDEKKNAPAEEQIRYAFQLATSRVPSDREVHSMQKILEQSRVQFAQDAELAMKMASDPIGPIPSGADPLELASWTVLGNVLLNLDEVLMTK